MYITGVKKCIQVDKSHRCVFVLLLSALCLLQAKYDLDQAMVLCQMNDFKAGILYLYEKAHL